MCSLTCCFNCYFCSTSNKKLQIYLYIYEYKKALSQTSAIRCLRRNFPETLPRIGTGEGGPSQRDIACIAPFHEDAPFYPFRKPRKMFGFSRGWPGSLSSGLFPTLKLVSNYVIRSMDVERIVFFPTSYESVCCKTEMTAHKDIVVKYFFL